MPQKSGHLFPVKGMDTNGQRAHHTGFTLLEVMIAIAVFAIAMTGVYAVYYSQMRTHYTQLEIVNMQENLRAALYLMDREIKMAGLDPTGKAGAGIVLADTSQLHFTMDFTGGDTDGIDDDGDGVVDVMANGDPEWYDGKTDGPNEDVTYALSGGNLTRNGQNLALNIDALNFVYLDANGNVLATPVADTGQIRTVQVSIVARSSATPSQFDLNMTDTRSYANEQGTVILPAQNDHFRRLMMSADIKCRNMGL